MKPILTIIIRLTTVLTLILALTSHVVAQTLTLPYFNSWEDPVENAAWTCNSGIVGNAAPNRWYISSKSSYTGHHSLLISDLSLSPDTLPVYSSSAVNIVAARTIFLPAGEYDLSFAYRVLGDTDKDGLYVAWIDNNENISTTTAVVPTWATDYTSVPCYGRIFSDSRYWRTQRLTITSDGRNAQRLAFLWTNDGTQASDLSVCIDDIQIARRTCGEINNIRHTVSDGIVSLSWDALSPGTTYEVMYHSHYADHSGTITGIRTNSIATPVLPNGLYTFYVRAVCGTDRSIYYHHDDVIVYNNSCIDYTDLNGSGVTCYTGTYYSDDRNPYKSQGDPVDYGEDSIWSRHTLNLHLGETDPRTGGALPKIPDNEFVSVRLGNWHTEGEAEAISYDMMLDSGANTILLMKYAVVLQLPDKHDSTEQPKFRLEILDGKTNALIDPDCGIIDFYASEDLVNSGWHDLHSDEYERVIYKDWSDLGVDLSQYAAAGDRAIKVRLTSYDCSQGGHFGYAYFTLDCTSGHLDGVSCVATDELKAPYGFRYHWYKAGDPDKNLLSDRQIFPVRDADVGTYSCDCISLENDDCFFTLTASLLPHLPVADFDVQWRPRGCQNYVRLTDRSRIEAGGQPTDDEFRAFRWTLPDDSVNVTDHTIDLPFPDAGGTDSVKLAVFAREAGCADSVTISVTAPPIGIVYDTMHVDWCSGGNPYVLNGKTYSDAGDYEVARNKTFLSGCDSVTILSLSIVETITTTFDTVICHGDTLRIGTQTYTTSNDAISVRLRSANGCDSIVSGRLRVQQSAITHSVVDATGTVRHGSIILSDTLPGTTWTLDGTPAAPLDHIAPGHHILELFEPLDGSPDRHCPTIIEFDVAARCLQMQVHPVGEICADDSLFILPLTIDSGVIASYTLRFDSLAHSAGFTDIGGTLINADTTISIPLPADARPGHYSMYALFTDSLCDPVVFPVTFSILYPSSVMTQKWNDAIAVYDSEHNGGYRFSAFSWYRDGIPVPSVTSSYLYLDDNTTFAPGTEIRVSLTRADDHVTVLSCPLITAPRTDIADRPRLASSTVAPASAAISLTDVRHTYRVDIYDLHGRLHTTATITPASPHITVPPHPGIYILSLTSPASHHTFKILVTP